MMPLYEQWPLDWPYFGAIRPRYPDTTFRMQSPVMPPYDPDVLAQDAGLINVSATPFPAGLPTAWSMMQKAPFEFEDPASTALGNETLLGAFLSDPVGLNFYPGLMGGQINSQQIAPGLVINQPGITQTQQPAPVEDLSFPQGMYEPSPRASGSGLINPLALALLSAGAAGLQKSGWQPRQVTLGEGLGAGMEAGLGTYLQAQQMQERSEIAREELAGRREYREAMAEQRREQVKRSRHMTSLIDQYRKAGPGSSEQKAILEQIILASKPEALLPEGAGEHPFTKETGLDPSDPKNAAAYQAWLKKKTEWQPQSQINVDVKTAQSFWDKFAEVQAAGFSDKGKIAREAALSLRANQEARSALDKGAITGFGADFRLGFGRFLQLTGVNFVEDPVANTDAFTAAVAGNVGRLIKQFGAGTGLSDADREFATKMSGGQIKLTEQAIRRILDINDRASSAVVRIYNEEAAELMKHPGAAGLPFKSLEIPTTDLPGFAQEPWEKRRGK